MRSRWKPQQTHDERAQRARPTAGFRINERQTVSTDPIPAANGQGTWIRQLRIQDEAKRADAEAAGYIGKFVPRTGGGGAGASSAGCTWFAQCSQAKFKTLLTSRLSSGFARMSKPPRFMTSAHRYSSASRDVT